MITSPHLDALRLELVSAILKPARHELLQASDTATEPEHTTLIRTAAAIDWLIAQTASASVTFKQADERMAGIIYNSLLPEDKQRPQSEDPDAAAAMHDMTNNPRPDFPTTPLHTALPATTTALDQADQIMSWSNNTALVAARGHVITLRRLLTP